MSERTAITRLLLEWRGGSERALDQLVPLVYDELRRLAARRMRGERADHTWSATDLVHEAYARLVDADIQWQDRVHFFAVASRLMRRILVDHARASARQKRGGGALRVTLDDSLQAAAGSGDSEALLALDAALERLAEFDRRKAEAVELHYFGGLSYEETAEALGVSPATVDRELRMAKAWLGRELAGD